MRLYSPDQWCLAWLRVRFRLAVVLGIRIKHVFDYWGAKRKINGVMWRGFVRAVNFFCQLFLIKWFLLFWMCDLVAHAHQCKLISFFIFNICCFVTKMHFGCNLLYPASHHVMSSVSWSLDSACVVFYWWSIATIHLSYTVMEIWSLNDLGFMTLTFWGHVTSSFTLPFNSAYAASYWWSIVTMRVSCTIMEIWSLKDFAVTTLTFWGHVTSSVTWPFDTPCGVSYRWSMVTRRLSCTVSEITR